MRDKLDLGSAAQWRRELAAGLCLGLFVGLIGPFGAFLYGPTGLRMAYWAFTMVVGVILYGLGLRLALFAGAAIGQPPWFILPLAVLVLCLPMSVLTAVTDIALWPRVARYMRPFDWYGEAVIISLPLCCGYVWLKSRSAPKDAPSSEAPTMEADFLATLPLDIREHLICLHMEDHYVRAHSPQRSVMVLAPFHQALASVAHLEGVRTHRSWWAARAALRRAHIKGRSVELELEGGLRLPVSRTALPLLRERGWLADDVARQDGQVS